MSNPPVLQLFGLRHGYGDRLLFDNLDLALCKGEHRLLLAPSGTGKTTLINLIAGLLTPDAGEVRVCGEMMSGAPALKRDDLRRRHIGVIFQTLRLAFTARPRQGIQCIVTCLSVRLADCWSYWR